MVEYLALLSLFLLRQDKIEREHTQYKRLLQGKTASSTGSQLTETIVTELIGLQEMEVRDKDNGAFATQGVVSPEFISSFKNITSSLKVTPGATVASRPTYQALSSVYHSALSNEFRSSLVASTYSTGIRHSTTEIATPVISSQVLPQSRNILALTSFQNGPSSFSSLGYNHNFTSLISSSGTASSHMKSLPILISTSSKLPLASLIAITSSSPGFDREVKATASSSSILPIESLIPSKTMSFPISATTIEIEIAEPSTALNITSSTKDISHHSLHHTPYISVVVGSIMGSLAGVAFLVLFMILLLRWQKSNKWIVPLDSEETSELPHGVPRGHFSGHIPTQKPHNFSMPAALASLTVSKLMSQKKCRLSSSSNHGEKAFYRTSGRMIPSVFLHGGNGFGDAASTPNISNASFLNTKLRDPFSVSNYTSRSTLAASSSGVNNSVIYPNLPPLNSLLEPDLLQPQLLRPPQRPDSIGRSRPSMDSSLTSRFTEDF